VGGQTELAQGAREPEAVHETEREAHEPAACHRGRQAQILGGHRGDGQPDHRLDQAVGEDDDVQHGQRERHAVGERERRDDLRQREQAAARQQQTQQKEQVIVAAQDVMNAEQQETAGVAGGGSPDAEAGFTGRRLEGELAGPGRPLDPGQRVVIGPEHVEHVVADLQLAKPARAREVHQHGEGRGIERRPLHHARPRLAVDTIATQLDRPPQHVEQAFLGLNAACLSEPKILRHPRGKRGCRENDAIPDRGAVDADRRVPGAAAGVSVAAERPGHEEHQPERRHDPRACQRPASASTCSHSSPTKRAMT
jgi:hypothetical protein